MSRPPYTNQLKASLEYLCQNPERGRLIERIAAGLRYFKSGRHYIFYFNSESHLQIVGILHVQMNHEKHLGLP